MDTSTTLSRAGSTMAVAGLLSIVLYLINFNLSILMWIDIWGPVIGWAIRIAIVLLGVGLLVAGRLSRGSSSTTVRT